MAIRKPRRADSNDQYESDQVTKTRLATRVYGGDHPHREDVIRSANAKAGRRHELKGQDNADESVLPRTKQPDTELGGINNMGYLDKHGTAHGVDARFNKLPPGWDIGNQETSMADRIDDMPFVADLQAGAYKADVKIR